ncbi:MAG TPA: manganese efflux pump [Bryobacteraceae bacterium]|nr:manganese efflux pump [Bryobacteraceae bacterium]
MLGTVIFFGVLAGADNLQVCSALGLLPIRGARKHVLALAFTACETMAPLAGLALGRFLLWCAGGAAARIGPFMMLACGIVILFYAVRGEDLAGLVNGNKMIMGVPVALSFDNLLAGAGISSLHYPAVVSALVIGLVSAVMSCTGLYLGAWVRRFVPNRMEFAVGAYLCVLAGRAMFTGGA